MSVVLPRLPLAVYGRAVHELGAPHQRTDAKGSSLDTSSRLLHRAPRTPLLPR